MGYTLQDVINAVKRVTSNPHEQATLLYACGAESNCDPNAVQIGGGPGRGAWQIETTWLPANEAFNPYTAAQALYSKWNVPGCTDAQGGLWQSDPATAARNAAQCTERAAQPYNSAAQTRGQTMAFNNPLMPICDVPGLGNICKLPIGPTGPINSIGSAIGAVTGDNSPLGGIGNFFGMVMSIFSDPDWFLRVLLIVGGFALVMMGVGNLMHITAVPVPVP